MSVDAMAYIGTLASRPDMFGQLAYAVAAPDIMDKPYFVYLREELEQQSTIQAGQQEESAVIRLTTFSHRFVDAAKKDFQMIELLRTIEPTFLQSYTPATDDYGPQNKIYMVTRLVTLKLIGLSHWLERNK